MPLAPALELRTLVQPDGRSAVVVVRRRRHRWSRASASVPSGKPGARDAVPTPSAPAEPPELPVAAGFSRPVARALAALGARARPVGGDGVALDGRRAPLIRVVAEANRALAAAGRPPIAYPCLRPEGRR